jgi:hypothetical protein
MQHSHTRLRVLVFTVALVTVGAIAAVMPVAPKAPLMAHDWVRTVDGWQRASWRASARFEPRLHPVVVALELALLSTLFLMIFSRPATQNAAHHLSFPQLDRRVGRPHAWQHRAEHQQRQPVA